jgi:hypothetical protein
MKKWWSDRTKHLDEEKLKQKAKAKEDLRYCREMRDEKKYVEIIKALRPNVSPEELIQLIELFRKESE